MKKKFFVRPFLINTIVIILHKKGTIPPTHKKIHYRQFYMAGAHFFCLLLYL